MILTRIGLASALLALGACADFCPPPPPVITPKPVVIEKPVPVDNSCSTFKPILIDSQKDVLTPETAAEIRDHNMAGVKHCDWKPKAAPPAAPTK